MDKYPFDTTYYTQEDTDRFTDAYTALKAKFDIEIPGQIDFHLNQFDLFKNYLGIKPEISFVIKHLNCDSYIFFMEMHFRTTTLKGTSSYEAYEYQTWALAFLKKDFGRVMIRRETLADKILELVHPIELDFAEDKPFSDTFYVLVNDHQKAITAIDRNFRNAVMDIRHDDFVIEIHEHTLIIGDRRPITPERAVHMAEFVSRVSTMC